MIWFFPTVPGILMLCRKSVRWLYKLDRNFTWQSPYRVGRDHFFHDDRTGQVRLIIEEGGAITVTSGYAWNGCSPKFCFLDILFGTPEGVVHAETEKPKTYYASLVHDALYQFLEDGLPFSRLQADAIFLRLLEEGDFAPRRVYWLFAVSLGWVVRFGTRLKRKWRGTSRTLDDFAPAPGTATAER